MPPPSIMLDEECDEEASVSMTWSVDPTGTLRHKASGLKVSSETGITWQGQEFKLSPGDIELEKDKHLGKGAGGVVTKGVIKKTGVQVAVKTVKIDDKAKRDQFVNEIRGLVTAQDCPFLVQWYAGFVNKQTQSVEVALEFMDLGSLRDLHNRAPGHQVPPKELSCIAYQITMGLQHLHNKHLLHRDIKPENILHNLKGEVKLTDFGIAKDLDHTVAMAFTFVGTATYMSPERCTGADYNFSADNWSVGMVLFELSTGRYPFADCSSFPALFDHLCEQPEPRLDASQFPPALCDFVALCLTRDVSKRPDTNDLSLHSYVTKGVPSQADLAEYLSSLG